MSEVISQFDKSPLTNIFAALKPKCVVDWLELEFHYQTPSPAWRVAKAAGGLVSRVTGLDEVTGLLVATSGKQGENTPTKRFRARIQDPKSISDITAVLNHDGIRQRLDPAKPVLIFAIEVSFDLYAKRQEEAPTLDLVTASLVQGIVRYKDVLPRVYREKGIPVEIPFSFQALQRAIENGYTVGIGHKDDDAYIRAYLKKSDAGQHLPPDQWRARIEVRLQGNACPVTLLDDLELFDFAKLAKHFKFKTPAPELSGLMSLIAGRSTAHGCVMGESGTTAAAHRYKGRKRKTKPHTRASPLNEIARDQLRKLTARWRTSAGCKRSWAHPASNHSDELSGGYTS